ncbi:MAG: transposase, partial [Culicoidibacterales bacterium]
DKKSDDSFTRMKKTSLFIVYSILYISRADFFSSLIQVEGAFGVMKHDYRFKRFLTRGKVEVGIEMLLLCFGYNVKKLHNKIKQKRLGHQLHSQNIA